MNQTALCLAAFAALAACGPAPTGGPGPQGGPDSSLHPLGYNYAPSNHASYATSWQALTATPPPPAVDNSKFNPPVGDQGQIGSCVAWASAYGASGYLANQAGAGAFTFAPMYLYDQVAAGCPDCGMEVSQALGILEAGVGAAPDFDRAMTASFTGYGASLPGLGQDAAANDLNALTAGLTQNASSVTLTRFERIFDAAPSNAVCPGSSGATEPIQAAIAAGAPVVVALSVPPEFDAYDGVHPVQPPQPGEASRGGHAIFCSKYDTGGLWCQNSWGTSWGHAGWVQLSWPFVEQCLYEADQLGALSIRTPQPLELSPVITSPSSGAALDGTVTIAVSVQVNAPGAAVQSVSIQAVNGNVLGQATAAGSSWTLALDSAQLPGGPLSIVAVAEDAQGYQFQSAPLALQVENLTPVFTTIQAGAMIQTATPIAGTIPDSTLGGCASVTIAADGQPLGAATLAGSQPSGQTFTFTMGATVPSDGPHQLTATCVDGSGVSFTSAPVQVNVLVMQGSIQLTSPTNGGSLQGQVSLTASVTDLGDLPASDFSVAFYCQPSVDLSGAVSASWTALAAAPSVSVTWDTTQVPDGFYTVRAVLTLTTSAGSLGEEDDITVTVANPLPQVLTMSSPTAGSVVSGTINLAASVDWAATSDPSYATSVCSASFAIPGVAGGEVDVPYGGGTAVDWDTTQVPNGPYTITAQMQDCLGNSYVGQPITVSVQNSISILSPTQSQTVSGEVPIQLSVIGFSIATVTYSLTQADGSANPSVLSFTGGSGPSFTWDSSTVPNDRYTLVATATDVTGTQWVSSGVVVTVAN
ncbi:MAG: C1 family peptidase [Myxococcales bacterium]